MRTKFSEEEEHAQCEYGVEDKAESGGRASVEALNLVCLGPGRGQRVQRGESSGREGAHGDQITEGPAGHCPLLLKCGTRKGLEHKSNMI